MLSRPPASSTRTPSSPLRIRPLRPTNASRFTQYNPEADIFAQDLADETPRRHNTPASSPTVRRGVYSTGGDIADLIDTGDLVVTREEPSAERLELEQFPVKRLQCICQSYGLSHTGRKKELIQRILDYEETHDASSCWRRGIPSFNDLFLVEQTS